jgi:hypothetical protein
MATGRIRRSARRGIAVAVLGWLAVAAMAVLGTPSASAAPQETVEIMNFTPPVKSVDKGGQITFVNKIPTQNRGGIALSPLITASATIYTDVSVTFFGQKKDLQFGQSAAWAFNDPATAGSITYTYRIVPNVTLAAPLVTQLVNTVAASLPPAPVNVPYVVETLVPLPTLPGVNLPQLPQVNVQVPTLPGTTTPTPPVGGVTAPPAAGGTTPTPVAGIGGNQYTYETGGVGTQLAPAGVAAGPAFDPSRLALAGGGSSGSGRGSSGSTGSGGLAGGYDGASVPVFGQLAGLNGSGLDDKSATRDASSATPAQTLPAAALAAVVALAAVTAALVRTHQASRASR